MIPKLVSGIVDDPDLHYERSNFTTIRTHLIHSRPDPFFIRFRFIERENNETDYLEIDLDSTKCRSQVGRQEGKQKVRVGGCNDEQDNFSYGMVIHELMHSLGKNHLYCIRFNVLYKKG